MATLTDTNFEGTYPPTGYSEFGTVANVGTSTNQANSGSTSMRVINASAATAYISTGVGGLANKVLVCRFYLYLVTNVSGTAQIAAWTNASGSASLRMLTTRVIRLTTPAGNFAGPTLNLNQWYRIDIRLDTTGANMVIDWQVDGAAQTQRSNAQASANFTEFALGLSTSVTCDIYFDDFKITDTSGDYPIGAPVAATARGFGQAQADIEAIGRGFGQAQSDIKATSRGFAQAQADIKQTYPQQVVTTLASDTFTRSVVDGFGSADVGGAYTNTGTAADYDVDGSVGTHNHPVINNVKISQLSITAQDIDVVIQVSTDKLAVGSSDTASIQLRKIDASNYYRFSYIFTTTQTVQVAVAALIPGVNAVVGTTTVTRETHAAGIFYNLRAQVQGTNSTTVRTKIWRVGTSEPIEWDGTGTDSSAVLQVAAPFAFASQTGASTSNAPVLFSWDNLNATTLQDGGFGQAQSDIKAIGRGFAQTQSDIKAVGRGFGQSQADIKATLNAFAQSQADIKAVSFGFGQAQGDIKQTYQAYGQATALIYGVPYLRDTFTRVEATGWGIADSGTEWVTPTPTDEQVDGSYGILLLESVEPTGAIQPHISINDMELEIAFAFSSPLEEVSDILTLAWNSNDAEGSDRDTLFQIRRIDASVNVFIGEGGNGIINDVGYITDFTFGIFYVMQVQLYHTDPTTKTFAYRMFKVGDPAPAWTTHSFSTTANPWGYLVVAAGSTDTIPVYIDYIYAQEYTPKAFGQAQSTITAIGKQFGQSQADIKAVGRVFAQAQADIKATSNAFAQAQATIRGNAFGQAQADIKTTYNVFAQSQADIQAVGYGFGQSNTDIKAISNAFAQAQADIKAIGYAFAQSQADIKATYQGYGQAQATIRGNAFGQAQADIKQTYQGYAQAQADIKVVYQIYAQAQADIKSVDNAFAQANADIKSTNQAYGQAQADIKTTYNSFAQSQADIKTVNYGFGQAQATIQGNVHGQSQADIKQIYQSYGQSQSDIKSTYQGYANAQADIKSVGYGFGQANADILAVGYGFGQAQAKISISGESVYGQAQADIKVTSQVYGQSQATITAGNHVCGQAQADIKSKNNGFGQSQADILTTYQQYGQSQAGIKATQYGWGQSNALIQIRVSEFGQAQADIKATSNQSGNAQADIKTTYNNSGQAQGYVETTTYVFGQAQTYIKLVQRFCGQAQAHIQTLGYGSGQAQSDIQSTTIKSANAQASIKVSVTYSGQAIASISTNFVQFAQAAAQIVSRSTKFGQANALIKLEQFGSGQAQGTIQKTAGYGQAQAYIDASILKALVVSDRNSINISILDFDTTDVSYTYQDIGLTISDRGLGLTLSDRLSTLELEDHNY